MKIFDTVADLKLARLGAGQIVKTKGYYTPNDGGGAEYLIVAAGTGTDDGGSYIDMALNQAQLVSNGTVNVKQFGAKGDGVADDATAINNGLTLGKETYIPAGTYLITQTLSVGNRQKVYGAGKFASIIKQSAVSTPTLLITTTTNSEYVNISHLGFRYNLVSVGDVTQKAINLIGTRRSTVEHCSVDNLQQSVSDYGGVGIYLDMESDTDAYTHRIDNNTVLGSTIGLWSRGPITSSVFTRNQFKTKDGMRFDRLAVQAGVSPITGNQIYGNLIQSHSSATFGTGNGIDFGQSDGALGFVYCFSNQIHSNYIERFANGVIFRDGSKNNFVGINMWDSPTNEIVDLNTEKDGYSGFNPQSFSISTKDNEVTFTNKGTQHTNKVTGDITLNGESDTLNVNADAVTITTDKRRIRVTGNGASRTGAILSTASAIEGQRLTLIGHSWSVALASTNTLLNAGTAVTLGNGSGQVALIEFEYDSGLAVWVECYRNTRV